MPVSQSAMVWQTSAATTETTETTSHRNTRKLEALATLAAVKTADDVCGFVAISTPTGKKGVQKGLLGRLLLPTRIHHHFCHPAMGWDHMGWYGMAMVMEMVMVMVMGKNLCSHDALEFSLAPKLYFSFFQRCSFYFSSLPAAAVNGYFFH